MEHKPEKRICQNCKKDFIIEPDDFSFYEKIKVPPPTFCPECRMQRRLAWRNEHNLHFRNCDITNKKIISIYSKNNKFPVYERNFWWSDKWNQNSCGLEIDFSKSFFEQFKELSEKAPRPNLLQTNIINGEFSNYVLDSKNIYMVFSGVNQENTMYCIGSVTNTTNSLDIHLSDKIENSYWSVQCLNSFGIQYSKYCIDCIDSTFLVDCHNCQNCFGCVNLRNKSYCIWNEQYSKEDYFKIISKYNIGSYYYFKKIKQKFNNFVLTNPFRYARIYKSTNCTGDDIKNAKNCQKSFYVKNNSENIKYSYRVLDNARDGLDLTLVWDKVELIYESLSITRGMRVFFSSLCWEAQDVWYSDNCFNCKNIFGCIGLKSAEYYILNKQYTKKEYEELVPKIIKHMSKIPYIDKIGRKYYFGEFFPVELSPFPYNEGLAQQYYPLSQNEISNSGFSYLESEGRNYKINLLNQDIPDDINDVKEDILNKVIECQHKGKCNDNCQKAYKIVPEELAFYRRNNITLPRLCLNCRHQERLKQINPINLWHRQCMCELKNHNHQARCPIEFETSYSPQRKEIIYCEKCYQKEVY